ncbi:GNAT family N-acetyltransferase [Pseudovibrio sp. Tun.PSC04-5.I4]|uniref:GNAT family N-acetyltransferase n=1 Tax=Pseudovibrio sp. Tun.PSC04-5.I4 TaxID=1798213 RepID=UPI000886D8F3|nr:GNAT family N-acetyltransferase [Pseudovibrio sp. Tun.PSC04-5.I4]SDQ78554.1 Acetyltransferase (GNAT) family protein [Pseudovibrio sp. Tun.PSC04-5.I4]
MIRLQTYDPSHFADFKHTAISEYVVDLMTNHRMDEQAALKKATDGVVNAFPDGVSTDQNKMLSIMKQSDKGEAAVGHLWYARNDENSIFIMDFLVYSEHRGMGYASQALEILKATLKAEGLTRIGLRVEPNNQAAIRVYEKVGFVVTGWNMANVL